MSSGQGQGARTLPGQMGSCVEPCASKDCTCRGSASAGRTTYLAHMRGTSAWSRPAASAETRRDRRARHSALHKLGVASCVETPKHQSAWPPTGSRPASRSGYALAPLADSVRRRRAPIRLREPIPQPPSRTGNPFPAIAPRPRRTEVFGTGAGVAIVESSPCCLAEHFSMSAAFSPTPTGFGQWTSQTRSPAE